MHATSTCQMASIVLLLSTASNLETAQQHKYQILGSLLFLDKRNTGKCLLCLVDWVNPFLRLLLLCIFHFIFQNSGGMSNSQSAHDISACDDDDGYGEIGVYARHAGTAAGMSYTYFPCVMLICWLWSMCHVCANIRVLKK